MTKLLSIVIPCYNVEQYLAECLDSILDSKYNDVLEVLAINDGSKDGTLAVARKYEARFPEILRVIDKPNGGWGTVINMAIAEARGRYFKILDSDDWFDKVAFAEFMTALQGCEADIFISSYTEIYADRVNAGKPYASHLCHRLLTLEEYLAKADHPGLFPMTDISVRTEILRGGHLSIPDRYYGDICYFIYTMALSQSVYITNINLYQYRKSVEGQSTSFAGYMRNYRDYIEVTRRLIAFYGTVSLAKQKRKVIKSRILFSINFLYMLLMSNKCCARMEGSAALLKEFNAYLRKTSSDLYWSSFLITYKHVPYLMAWRLFRINLFNIV